MTDKPETIPVLDIAPLAGPAGAARDALDRTIGEALAGEGRFLATGLPAFAGLDARARRLLAFFDRPAAEKERLATETLRPGSGRLYRGYSRSVADGDWAHNEMIDFGPEPARAWPAGAGSAPPAISVLTESNLWPEPAPAPGWRRDLEGVFGAMMQASQLVFASLARHLGLDADRVEAVFADSNSTLRLLNYLKKPEAYAVRQERLLDHPDEAESEAPPLAASRHTDACALSLLWQQDPGLQTQTRAGRWQSVPLVADGFSLHLGDTMEILTDGRLAGTPHRVLDVRGPRRSMGFFFEPGVAAPLASLYPGKGDAAAETYGAYVLRRISGYKGYGEVIERRKREEQAA